MKNKNTIIVSTTVFVCLLLFTGMSILSMQNMAWENMKEINTLLSYRVYDEISDSLNEPLNVSKTMNRDVFLMDFMKNEESMSEEEAIAIMQIYLESIRSEFGYDTAFVISEKTHRYYTYQGLNKVIDPENDPHDVWYKNFVSANEKYVMDVDVDEINQVQWTVFADMRMEDEEGNFLGVCGVGLRMVNVQKVFEEAQENNHVKINFVDKDGLVQIDTNDEFIENEHLDMSGLVPGVDGVAVRISPDGRELTVAKYIEPLDWYLVIQSDTSDINQQFKNVITINTVISIIVAVAILVFVIIIMRNSGRKTELTERISKQLSATADIYISMHEIDLAADTYSEVINNKTEAKGMIGEQGTGSQELIRTVMTKFSDPVSLDAVQDFVDFSKLNERLKERNTITLEWFSAEKKWRRSRFIVSERSASGDVVRAMYLIEDIDAEKRERDKVYDTAQQLSFQIRSIANIYTSVHYVDMIHNSFAKINTTDSVVENMIGDDVNNAQQVIRDAMSKLTAEVSKKEVLAFVEFSSIEKNVAETGTATIEFINSRGKWCRGRFIVSDRTEDGRLYHVIWAVENIDTERRERDKLTEAARTLNARISSIANIYMTAHELDIPSDTFTEIKSQSDMVNDIIGETRTHAQETLRKVMEGVTDESCLEDVLAFVDLSTLDKRMRRNDTITFEYLNRDKLWRRGRFVASKRDERGKLIRVMWLSEDIHEEKKERDKLLDMSERAIAASEAKSSFLSHMTYELSTPINTVLGMDEKILRECDDSRVLAYAGNISKAGNALLGIVNNILDFSRIEAGKMEIVPTDYDLTTVIYELLNRVQERAEEKKLELNLKINREVPRYLHGDGVRVKQVIANILSNAVKYTEKGAVTFEISFEKAEDEQDAILLYVSVMDTGIGIKAEDMKKLFSAFDRIGEEENRSAEGTGLGMSITKKLLEMMDSSLEVESVYELGSKFSFHLKQKVVNWEEIGIIEKQKTYPQEKTGDLESVEESDLMDSEEEEAEGLFAVLKGSAIDPVKGLKNSGTEEAYLELLQIFYDSIDRSAEDIERFYREEDLKNYTIKVHALKSSARIIGAADFGEEAQKLENAGNEGDMEYIRSHHEAFSKECQGFKELLSGLFANSAAEPEKPEADEDLMNIVFEELQEAAADMDCERIESIIVELKDYSIPASRKELYEKVIAAYEKFDYGRMTELLTAE